MAIFLNKANLFPFLLGRAIVENNARQQNKLRHHRTDLAAK